MAVRSARVQVLPVRGEGEKPVHVVDAAAGVLDLVLRHVDELRDLLDGGLHPVAETDEGDAVALPSARQLPAMGFAYCSMTAPGLETSCMSRAISSSTGMVRMARKTPPGPSVSPTHWSTLYFRGICQSILKASTPPTWIMTTTKSASFSASRRSSVAHTEPCTPLSLSMRQPNSSMARSFGSVRLMRANSLPSSAGVAMMSAIRVLQNTTLPAPIIAIFFAMAVLLPGGFARRVMRLRSTAARMNVMPSAYSASGLSKMSRQIRVAAAKAGSTRPKASMVSQLS